MRPINFVGATGNLAAPADWPTDRPACSALPVMQEEGVFYSVWKPSLRQRIGLLFGKCVILGVMASRHPPVSLGISDATEVNP